MVSPQRWDHLMRDRNLFRGVSLVLHLYEAVCNKDHFFYERTLFLFEPFLQSFRNIVRVGSNAEYVKWTDKGIEE
jgi:hypothetical protein